MSKLFYYNLEVVGSSQVSYYSGKKKNSQYFENDMNSWSLMFHDNINIIIMLQYFKKITNICNTKYPYNF